MVNCHTDQETCIQAVFSAVRDGKDQSLRQAAKLFDISRSTLTNCFNGKVDRKTAQHSHQRLSPEEEESLSRQYISSTPGASQ